jgi:hypothetical protein
MLAVATPHREAIIMGWLFKSEEQRWAEAKQDAHKQRAANGQKVTGRAKSYTTTQQIKDQERIEKAKRR